MKKILLFVLALGVGYAVSAQTLDTKPVSAKAPNFKQLMEAPVSNAGTVSDDGSADQYQKSANNLNGTFVQLGSAGNAWSSAYNGRTHLWADPKLNSIAFTHRMTGGIEVEGNSRVSYDFSTNGGASFTNDIQVYAPTGPDPGTGYPMNAGRYPQGGILNPPGNTDPANAYYTYQISSMNGDNNNWGSYAHGSAMFGTGNSTQVNWASGGDTWRVIPDAFHISQNGVAWYLDGSQKWDPTQPDGGAYMYNGNLILGRGEIVDGEIVYTEELVSFLEEDEGINDYRVAFAPDGQTGYLCMMAQNDGDPMEYTSYHPVLLKTTDGGETWSDPIQFPFGGEDGFDVIKDYYPDSTIIQMEGYEEWDGNRDELWFNMGFHCDLAVDAMGNPYILGMMALATEDGWFPQLGFECALFSKDGGETWHAEPLWHHDWWTATIGSGNNAVTLYNRPQVSIDYDGHNIFYSWLDSEAEQAEANERPNIYLMGYDIEDEAYTEIEMATYFTQAWNKAFMGSQSYYVFKHSPETFEIPLQYVEFTESGDPTAEVNYWYIDDYIITPVDVPEFDDNKISFTVGQNFPNPANQTTEILVSSDTDLPIELRVSNMLGQLVYSDAVEVGTHGHAFRFSVRDFEPGLYLYSVKIGSQSITKKMLVD